MIGLCSRSRIHGIWERVYLGRRGSKLKYIGGIPKYEGVCRGSLEGFDIVYKKWGNECSGRNLGFSCALFLYFHTQLRRILKTSLFKSAWFCTKDMARGFF